MDCSLPGSSVHGDSPGKNNGVDCHALVQGSSQFRDWTQVSHIAGGFFTVSAIREAPHLLKLSIYILCPYYFTSGYSIPINQFSSVQSLSCVWLSATPWTAVRQASLSITNFRSLLELMTMVSVMPSNHLILCHPLLLLPSIFPSIRVFSNESFLLIRWPKYWSFSISLSNEYSELISFRMDWLDLLAVLGTLLESLLQHNSSKASHSPTLTSTRKYDSHYLS